MDGCDYLEKISEWLWLFKAHLRVGVPFDKNFDGWMWMGVTVENIFMGGCTLFRIHLWVCVCVCVCVCVFVAV